jgi:hypothetical protein
MNFPSQLIRVDNIIVRDTMPRKHIRTFNSIFLILAEIFMVILEIRTGNKGTALL